MNDTPESYRAHWAALTGRPESEIYVPKNLAPAPWSCTWCGALNSGLAQSCATCGAART